MNIVEVDILKTILVNEGESITQRQLADAVDISVGQVNKKLRELADNGYITKELKLTQKAQGSFEQHRPHNAIIMAAGPGIRMLPLDMNYPKGLLKKNDQTLIERLVEQLQEAGISDIRIIVGYKMEQYEYLCDKYKVELVYNNQYSKYNNLHSIECALGMLGNTYVIPCDLYFVENPFSKLEGCSWYMVKKAASENSFFSVNRKNEVVMDPETRNGITPVGLVYLTTPEAEMIKANIQKLCQDKKYDREFWEAALFEIGDQAIYARYIDEEMVTEINTYEDLRELSSDQNQLKSAVMDIICKEMKCSYTDIKDITVLKKGMTNRSLRFTVGDNKYYIRIPEEDSNKLIDRNKEFAVYQVLKNSRLGDNLIFFSAENGIKITEFWENARVCDPGSAKDVSACMRLLREFHEMKLSVPYRFDLFERIDFYAQLWNGVPSVFQDHTQVTKDVYSLRPVIEKYKSADSLTHIDAVPDNFLFIHNEIRLIDWEYAGMNDPHIDIAMFAIYSMYDREKVDALIDAYFTEGCTHENRMKIYCYIAACGLLWSNWCEYKRTQGVEFGKYAVCQYRFAKEYYRIVMQDKEMAALIQDGAK